MKGDETMKRLITICVATGLLLAGSSAQGNLTNGDFETGDLTGWI